MKITTTLVVLNPGIYVLRHPKGDQPALTVTRAPGAAANNGTLELLSTPGTHGSILRNGADCIVMQVSDAPVELAVSAYLPDAAATVPALRIDQIALDAGAPAIAAPSPAPAAPVAAAANAAMTTAVAPGAARSGPRRIEIGDKGISIIAHIERTGDVVASDGAPVGDPAQTLRVEGFQVMWPDRPAGLDLAYSINVEGIGQMPAVTTGKFCGTRGQARRITELSFTLVGPDAATFALEGTAWFTGGFQQPVSSGAALGGPSGLEHLTALSLKAVPANVRTGPAGNPWAESATTKVFRAKSAGPAKSASKKFAAPTTSKARKG